MLRSEFDKALQDFHNRLSEIETKLDIMEDKCGSPTTEIKDLAAQVDAARKEARQFAVSANDTEQYSRRNNLRIKGLNIPQGDGVD